MDFEGNYLARGTVDVSGLQRAVLAQTAEQWAADSFRQMAFKDAHQDTESIPLLFDRDFRHKNPTPSLRYAEFEHLLEPIFEKLRGTLEPQGWIVRCMFARLHPRGFIPPHIDQGFSLSRVHRCHVPIVTSEDVTFSVRGEEKKMKPGEIWEINNRRLHSTWNRGKGPRVHLICDWAPPLSDADERVLAAGGGVGGSGS